MGLHQSNHTLRWCELCRDMCKAGYAVGTDLHDSRKPPGLLDYDASHVLCYDVEYAGAGECSHDAPILYVSMSCKCAWRYCVTRRSRRHRVVPYVVLTTNEDMAEHVMQLIVLHKPIFTPEHNAYGFDNKVLALALGKGHPMSIYFRQVMRSDVSTATDFGLMMTVPGINNLDTYRFIRQSVRVAERDCFLALRAGWLPDYLFDCWFHFFLSEAP